MGVRLLGHIVDGKSIKHQALEKVFFYERDFLNFQNGGSEDF